ncbi:DUF637 domain-containing protein [Pseudomonas cichorii]|uniref:DUF637 domain-containing protein n=1 Tax=Pseudomonas cichorii TaxID=36746 RepID=UPI001F3173B1|nr:DUF637 domain-containing protein [Pseudomonas cichorii]
MTLTGKYASNGQATSLGRLGLSAANVEVLGAGRIAGAADVQVRSDGVLLNQGRITSARDLTLTANSLTNNGTMGSAGKLDLVSQVLRNEGASSGDQSLISSGGDMRLLVGDFTNRFATVYSLGGLLVARDAALNRSNRIDNISATLQSSGAMGLYGTTISNRKDAFSVSEQVLSGTITYQCLNCKGRHYDFFYYVTEEIARSVQADSASSSINAGGALKVQSSLFENKHSTVSAASSIDISTDNFNNEGASTESVLRTRQFRNPDDAEGSDVWLDMVSKGGVIAEYAKYNSKTQFLYFDTWSDGDGWEMLVPLNAGSQDTGQANPFYRPNSGYAVPAHILTYWLYDSWETQTNTGVAANAVIQAGGAVNIAASKNLGNGVTRQNTGYSSLALNAANTQTGSQINPNTASINAQLSPDLAQQQVNPLTLPGFSLPTGQNGLFRLSAQTGSNVAATQTSTAPQNWTLGSASVSVAQREQTVSDTQARALQFGTAGQVSSATRQLADVVRQNSGLSANASAFDSSAPVYSATRLQLTGHSAGSTGLTQVADVTQVLGQNGTAPLPGQGATIVPVITPVASSNTTAQNGTTTPTAVPNNQVARVQALPGTAAPSNPHKYLIETNPVLTELRQFMSSDYLLANLGYDPEASARRLGDGLYEQRLVQQAVVARTGQAFLAGQTSNEAQLKYLMDNAIASKEQLNLAVGVSLSSLQVAALTHDIVWLEEHEVNGEKVLVPVLYLAQANNRLAPTGALIAGNDVTLTAGENLDNVGTLRATNNLSATAGNNLVNTGLIEAGNRLDLLAGNDLINKAGGILYGRDVTLSATRGDVINERTVTRAVGAEGYQDFADSAARVESANDLTIKAGRDVMSIGGTLQAGRDLSLIAGRDLNIGATQIETAKVQGANTQSSITQLGSSVSVGRDLMALSGRDINVVASEIDVKRDIAMAATENMTISSAADETHSLSRSKKLTVQTDHVKQVSADLNAGGSIALNAGQDLAVISSRITAGENANLSAGENLSILAAQDSDYYLYDKKSKGSWGKKKTKRDEVTDIRNVGSEITSGGDLTLESGGDQLYQVAKLTSGNDLSIESGGGITFEGVKDFHDESHTKSKNSATWFSSKGKGRTDETLRQSELVAQGDIVIKAVDGLRIDVKQVNQESVSQSIDAMVQADPQLAWLKEAEKRGDVDWRQVKEIHESFKYNNSGLGPAAQIAIAILMSFVMGPAGFGLMGATGAVASSVATTTVTSAINNKGDLGAILKDVTSANSIKGYALAGMTAGLVPAIDPANMGFNLASVSAVTQKVVVESALKTAIMGGSFKDNLAGSAVSAGISIAGAVAANEIGDYALINDSGKLTKVAMHAALGGLMAEAMGGDFRTGALAAGANEALVGLLAEKFLPAGLDKNSTAYQAGVSQLMTASQLIGVLTGAVTGGDASAAAAVTANATQYNYLNHIQLEEAAKKLRNCVGAECDTIVDEYRDTSVEQQVAALVACKSKVSLCAPASKEVANTMADLSKVYEALGDASDLARGKLQLLINENLEFQGIMAMATAGATGEALADAIQAKTNLSPEQMVGIRDALMGLGAVAGGVAAYNSAKKAGSDQSKNNAAKPNANSTSDKTDAELGVREPHPVAVPKKADREPLVSKGSDVTPDIIQKALQGDSTISGQNFVSLPAIQRYVDRLLKGDVAPPIKMDGDVIVDGNHRYIAAKILGRNPEVAPGTLSPNKAGQGKPISDINVDLADWGNR